MLDSPSETDASNAIAYEDNGRHMQRYTNANPTSNHSHECVRIPVSRSKPSASNGMVGASGHCPSASLEAGRDGKKGAAKINVLSNDGSVSSYYSRFEFRLLSFEVTDENDDGIFEPGECVIIKNFRIQNSGTSRLTSLNMCL